MFEFTIVSDGNSNQELDIVISGDAAEWALSSITEIELGPNDGTEFTVTVDIPDGTTEGQYMFEVLIMDGDLELDNSVNSVIVQVEVEEVIDILLCLEATDECFAWSPGSGTESHSLEFTFDSDKLGQANIDFSITNQGNLESIIAFEFATSDGTSTSNTLSIQNEDGDTVWMIGIVPQENLILSEDQVDYGTLSIVGNKASPGSYTYTFSWMQVIETETGSQLVDMGEISITINVEGDVVDEGGSSNEEDDSLLPGPSFVSVILILSAIVYRRRR